MTSCSPDHSPAPDTEIDAPLHRRAFDFATKAIRIELLQRGTHLFPSPGSIQRISSLAAILEDLDEPLLAPGPVSREISRRCLIKGFTSLDYEANSVLVDADAELFRLPWLLLKVRGLEVRIIAEDGQIFSAGLLPA